MNSTLNGPISRICLRLDRMQLGLFFQFVFFQAALHQRKGEGGAVDRNVDFGQKQRHGADVVFVAVRQKQGPHRCRFSLR